MIKLTKRERDIVSRIVGIQSKGERTFELDELISVIPTRGRKRNEEGSRNSIAGSLRDISLKVGSVEGLSLRRISELGAGRKAVYEVKGNFSSLLAG